MKTMTENEIIDLVRNHSRNGNRVGITRFDEDEGIFISIEVRASDGGRPDCLHRNPMLVRVGV